MTEDPHLGAAMTALTAAWNAADGDAFAAEFTDDADFVNIYAMHAKGRQAIARAHQAIFDGVYRGSRIAFAVMQSRALADGIVLAHIGATLQIPSGPLAGTLRALATAVFVREGSSWKISAFHNTREQEPPGR